MRNALIACAALALVAAAVGSAVAREATTPQGQIQTFNVSQKPAAGGKASVSRATRATILVTLRRADGGKPSPHAKLHVDFPKGMVLNHSRFPKCDSAKLAGRGPKACPKGSRIGRGTLVADAGPFGAAVDGVVFLYNGKRKRIYGTPRVLLLYMRGEVGSPFILTGTLDEQRAPGFGRSVDFDFPLPLLLQVQQNATITRLQLEIGAAIRKVPRRQGGGRRVEAIPYLVNPRRCVSGYRWQMRFRYENGESLAIEDAVPCKP